MQRCFDFVVPVNKPLWANDSESLFSTPVVAGNIRCYEPAQ